MTSHSRGKITELIGIDPGLLSAGVFSIDPRTGLHLRHALIKGIRSGAAPLPARVFQVNKVLVEYIYEVEGYKILAVEGTPYKMRSSSMDQMARCRQAIYDLAAFFLEDFEFMEMSPTKIKKLATGKGNASKEQVAEVTHGTFGGDIEEYRLGSYAVSDAAAVAMAARSIRSEETK